MDTALEGFFKSLQEEEFHAEDLVIYFDNDEIIISPVEDKKSWICKTYS